MRALTLQGIERDVANVAGNNAILGGLERSKAEKVDVLPLAPGMDAARERGLAVQRYHGVEGPAAISYDRRRNHDKAWKVRLFAGDAGGEGWHDGGVSHWVGGMPSP